MNATAIFHQKANGHWTYEDAYWRGEGKEFDSEYLALLAAQEGGYTIAMYWDCSIGIPARLKQIERKM